MKEPEYLFTEDKSFVKEDFKAYGLAKGEYDNCRFINCDFYNSDLSDFIFSDGLFTGCNLSLVKLTKTAFRDTRFTGCRAKFSLDGVPGLLSKYDIEIGE